MRAKTFKKKEMSSRKGMNGKRGQITYEYLVILGLVILLVIPFFNYAFFALGGQINVGSGIFYAVELVNALEMVSELGQGSVYTIPVRDNGAVQKIEISRQGGVTLKTRGTEITLPSSVYIEDDVEFEEGKTMGIGDIVVVNDGKIYAAQRPSITEIEPYNVLNHKKGVMVYGDHFKGEYSVSIVEVSGKETISGNEVVKIYTAENVDDSSLSFKHTLRAGTYKVSVAKKPGSNVEIHSNTKEIISQAPPVKK